MAYENSIAADCWFLTGATASGKTAVGLALAEALGAEIVSLDSMAIYRGMDMGTAKPTLEERARTPHHLIDIVEPDEEFSVAQYLEAAHATIGEIRGRGREVLFVGGTPLYLKALLRGIVRRAAGQLGAATRNRARSRRSGQRRPARAARAGRPAGGLARSIPTIRGGLIRALEVYRATGQPISHQQVEFDEGRPAEACRVFVLRRSREEQHERIDARVEEMLQRGLVDEVRRLTSDGRRLGRTASQAVGYREVIDHLAGGCDEPADDGPHQDPHAAVRQAAGRMVPQPVGVPLGGRRRRAERG